MHERLIAEEVVERAAAQAREKGLARITRIRVRLGEESRATEEGLSFWFDLVKEGTLAEPAVLEIDKGEGDSILMTFLQGEAPDGYQGSRSRP